jgi:hypothetical protein
MTRTLELLLEEKRQFVRDGLIIRRKFIRDKIVQAAQRVLEDWYATSLDVTAINKYTQKTFGPNLGMHPDLLNVYYGSGLESLANSFVFPDAIQPVSTVQIQIRVPDKMLPTPQPKKSMHIDGVACPHLNPKELRTFTLLIGVLLSEVNEVDGGALRYVPGAHIDMAEWFRSEWTLGTTEQVPPRINTIPGFPFLGKPGDVILMHHLVPHAVGSNRMARPRFMLYFRVKHERHGEYVLDALRDPWLEFPSLRELLS